MFYIRNNICIVSFVATRPSGQTSVCDRYPSIMHTFIVTKMDILKSEICWELGTHFCILCYSYHGMKPNRKQIKVEPTNNQKQTREEVTAQAHWSGRLLVSQWIFYFGVSI